MSTLPWAPLERVVLRDRPRCTGGSCPCCATGQEGHVGTFRRPGYCLTAAEIGAELGITARQVHRFKHEGLTVRQADRFATRLNVHPSYVWGQEWEMACVGDEFARGRVCVVCAAQFFPVRGADVCSSRCRWHRYRQARAA